MKKFFMVIIMAAMMGCAFNPPPCPPQDIVISAQFDEMILYIPIPKGSFDDKDNYMTNEEFAKFMKDKLLEMEKEGLNQFKEGI